MPAYEPIESEYLAEEIAARLPTQHHSIILDMLNLESYRARAAQQREQPEPVGGGGPAE